MTALSPSGLPSGHHDLMERHVTRDAPTCELLVNEISSVLLADFHAAARPLDSPCERCRLWLDKVERTVQRASR